MWKIPQNWKTFDKGQPDTTHEILGKWRIGAHPAQLVDWAVQGRTLEESMTYMVGRRIGENHSEQDLSSCPVAASTCKLAQKQL
jgi:hypothetical protein